MSLPDPSLSAQRTARKRDRFLFPVIAPVAIVVASTCWSLLYLPSVDCMPGTEKDDVFYDNIAFNLANRGEFSLSFSDPTWRKPFLENNANGDYDWILRTRADGPTTSRAPAFPVVLAGTYRLFGRQWLAIRICNLIVLSAGLAFLITTVQRFCGTVAACFGLLFLCADPFVMRTAGQVMCEPMATGILAACLSIVIRIWNAKEDRAYRWLIPGILLGVAILFRSNMIAWVMQITVLSAATWAFLVLRHQTPARGFAVRFLLFIAGCLVVCFPWWVRNCQATGRFAPLGCGQQGLIGGYCEQSFGDRGNWSLKRMRMLQNEVSRELWARDQPSNLAEIEMAIADESRARSAEWITENIVRMPQLMLMRVQSHLGLHSGIPVHFLLLNGLLFLGGLLGIYGDWRRTGGWVALILFLSTATTALTWAHEGRYSLPVRPAVCIAAGIGTVSLWTGIFRRIRKSRKIET